MRRLPHRPARQPRAISRRSTPSIVPGHEVVGVVDALGPAAKRFARGDRVGIAWLRETDGTCAYCRRGRENLCPNARFTGWDHDGGYAEYAVVREDFAYALPPQIDDEHAAPLLCAGIIGYRAIKRAGVVPGATVGLYGFGGSAHLALQVLKHWRCRVFVMSRGGVHRELAEELGADWIGEAAERPPAPLDAAILFAPAGDLVPPAMQSLDRGGILAIAGIYLLADSAARLRTRSVLRARDPQRHGQHASGRRRVLAHRGRDSDQNIYGRDAARRRESGARRCSSTTNCAAQPCSTRIAEVSSVAISGRPSGKENSPMDVLTLLKEDHKAVGALLDEAVECEPGDGRLDALAQEIESALTIHAAIEEKYFYPALHDRAEEADQSVDVFEAYTEHDLIKTLIALLKSGRQPDEQFKAEVQVLGENVKHHVKEEESTIFSLARELLDGDELEELGETHGGRKGADDVAAGAERVGEEVRREEVEGEKVHGKKILGEKAFLAAARRGAKKRTRR